MISKGDALKENIRKRKAYLLKKKMVLAENKKYEDFISEVSDEAIYVEYSFNSAIYQWNCAGLTS